MEVREASVERRPSVCAWQRVTMFAYMLWTAPVTVYELCTKRCESCLLLGHSLIFPSLLVLSLVFWDIPITQALYSLVWTKMGILSCKYLVKIWLGRFISTCTSNCVIGIQAKKGNMFNSHIIGNLFSTKHCFTVLILFVYVRAWFA